MTTLEMLHALEAAGFDRPKAEAITAAIEGQTGPSSQLATKSDLAAVRTDLRAEMQAMELRLIKWLLGTVVGSVVASTLAIIGVMVRLLP